jgi:uncharacterized membrane protein
MREIVETVVREGVQWLRLSIELLGALTVGLGVVIAGGMFAASLLRRRAADFTAIRLVLARYLALALEFQLGADILSTAVAPTWDQIGQLGAIAVIRTGLNYFLTKEIQAERQAVAAERGVVGGAGGDGGPRVAPLPGAAGGGTGAG